MDRLHLPIDKLRAESSTLQGRKDSWPTLEFHGLATTGLIDKMTMAMSVI